MTGNLLLAGVIVVFWLYSGVAWASSDIFYNLQLKSYLLQLWLTAAFTSQFIQQ
jgi:hypothetical protein